MSNNEIRQLLKTVKRDIQYYYESGKREFVDLDQEEQAGLTGKIMRFYKDIDRQDFIIQSNNIIYASDQLAKAMVYETEHDEWETAHQDGITMLYVELRNGAIQMAKNTIDELFQTYHEDMQESWGNVA